MDAFGKEYLRNLDDSVSDYQVLNASDGVFKRKTLMEKKDKEKE